MTFLEAIQSAHPELLDLVPASVCDLEVEATDADHLVTVLDNHQADVDGEDTPAFDFMVLLDAKLPQPNFSFSPNVVEDARRNLK